MVAVFAHARNPHARPRLTEPQLAAINLFTLAKALLGVDLGRADLCRFGDWPVAMPACGVTLTCCRDEETGRWTLLRARGHGAVGEWEIVAGGA